MPFDSAAIGIILDMEDRLTAKVKKAGVNYESVVAKVEKTNLKMAKAVNTAMGDLADTFSSTSKLARDFTANYAAAINDIKSSIKPIRQPVELVFGAKLPRGFSNAIRNAVTASLSKVYIRMAPAMPVRRNPIFDQSIPMRTAFNAMAQPPDYKGFFRNLPRFATGGVVGNPKTPVSGTGPDKVLAMLQPGEMVLPKTVSDALVALVNSGPGKPTPKGLDQMFDALQLWAKAPTAKAMSRTEVVKVNMSSLPPEVEKAISQLGKSKWGALKNNIGEAVTAVGDFRDQVNGATPAVKKLQAGLNDLEDSAKLTRVAVLGVAFASLRDGASGVKTVMGELGSNPGNVIEGFVANLNNVNRTLGMSRTAMFAFGLELTKTMRNKGLSGVSSEARGESLQALVAAGTRQDMIRQLLPSVAALRDITGSDTANLMYQLADNMKMGADAATASLLSLRNMAKVGNISFDSLTESLQESLKGGFGAALRNLPVEARKRAIESAAQVQTAFSSSFGEGVDLIGMASDALGDLSKESDFLRAFGITAKETFELMQRGDPSPVLERITQQMALFRGNPQMMQFISDTLGTPGTKSALMRMAQSETAGDLVKNFNAVRDSSVNTGDAMRTLDVELDKSISSYQKLKNTLGSFVESNVPQGVLEFFDDLDPLLLLTSYTILRDLIPSLNKGGAALLRFVRMRAAAAPVLAAAMPTAGAGLAGAAKMLPTAAGAGIGPIQAAGGGLGGVGGAIANLGIGLGKGVGGAIGGVLSGIGTGMIGLSQGIAALGAVMMTPAGVLGLLGLAGALAAIALSVRIAGPALTDLFSVFADMDASQILSATVALLGMGPALVLIGAGMLALSVSLIASIPGFVLFAGVMNLMGADVFAESGGLISGVVMGLVQSFTVDAAQVGVALANVEASAKFVSAFSAILSTLAGAGLVAGLTTGKGVIGAIFAGWRNLLYGDPFQNLIAASTKISSTVNTLAVNMKGMDVKTMNEAMGSVTVAAQFMVSMGKIQKSVKDIDPGGGISRVYSVLWSGDAINNVGRALPRIMALVTTLSKAMPAGASGSQMNRAAAQLGPAAKLIETSAKMFEGVSTMAKAAPSTAIWGAVVSMFTGNSLTNIQAALPGLRSIITLLMNTFSNFVKGYKPGTRGGIASAGKILAESAPLFENIAKIGDSMPSAGVLGQAWNWLTGDNVSNAELGIKNLGAKILPAFATLPAPATFTGAQASVESAGKIVAAFKPLAEGVSAVGKMDVAWGDAETKLKKLMSLMQVLGTMPAVLARPSDDGGFLLSLSWRIPSLVKGVSEVPMETYEGFHARMQVFNAGAHELAKAVLALPGDVLSTTFESMEGITRLVENVAAINDVVWERFGLRTKVIAGIVKEFRDAAAGDIVVNVPTAENLKADVTKLITTLDELRQTIENSRSVEDTGTHTRLDEIIRVLGGKDVPPKAAAPGKEAKTDPAWGAFNAGLVGGIN